MIATGFDQKGASAPLTACAAPASVWDIQLVTRAGAPPLRFSGRLLSFHCLGVNSTAEYIKLWQMRRGGYILEHSVPTQGPKHTVTLSISSVAEAAADLESFCAELEESHLDVLASVSKTPSDAAIALFKCQVENSRVRDFLNLSGTALAQWDNWCA